MPRPKRFRQRVPYPIAELPAELKGSDHKLLLFCGDQGGWRTDPSKQATQFRLAVLVAEATIGRCLAEDGYLSARQLSVDLRQAAAWLAAGARFGG